MNSSLYNFEGGPFHVAAEAEGTLPGQERPHQMLSASRGTAKKKENLLTSNSLKVQAHLVVMSYLLCVSLNGMSRAPPALVPSD